MASQLLDGSPRALFPACDHAAEDVAGLARGDEVPDIVVEVVPIDMIHDQRTNAGTTDAPLDLLAAPMTIVRSRANGVVKITSVDEHTSVWPRQGMALVPNHPATNRRVSSPLGAGGALGRTELRLNSTGLELAPVDLSLEGISAVQTIAFEQNHCSNLITKG